MITSTVLNVLALALPLTMLQIYDRILLFEAVTTLGLLTSGVLIAILLEAILKMVRSYVGSWLGARFEHLAGCTAVYRLLASSLGHIERQGSGAHLERINGIHALKDFYAGQAVLTLLDLPFAALFLTLIYYLAGWLVVIPIFIFCLFIGVSFLISRWLYDAVQKRTLWEDRRIDFLIEVLNGVHSIKAMAMEAMMLRRYEKLQESCSNISQQVGLLGVTSGNLGMLFSQLNMVAVVGFGCMMVIDQQLTIGGLAACSMLSGQAIQPLQRAFGIWARFQSIRVTRDRLAIIFDLPPESEMETPELDSLAGGLEMRDVSYRFAPDKPPILENINLTVAPGETIAISGGNGSGKTTLLWLMQGALQPTSGTVLLDGRDISAYDPSSVRAKIAYLPQSGILFKGSIMDNLTMFRPWKDNEAEAFASRLGLLDFVTKMPNGFETLVDDGAAEILPQGVKQRIAIARALLDHPNLVLFDEANTSIDSRGDEELKQELMRFHGKVTLIMVSHRPSLVALADRNYRIQDRTLVQQEKKENKPPPPPTTGGSKPVTTPAPVTPAAPPPLLEKPNATPSAPVTPPVAPPPQAVRADAKPSPIIQPTQPTVPTAAPSEQSITPPAPPVPRPLQITLPENRIKPPTPLAGSPTTPASNQPPGSAKEQTTPPPIRLPAPPKGTAETPAARPNFKELLRAKSGGQTTPPAIQPKPLSVTLTKPGTAPARQAPEGTHGTDPARKTTGGMNGDAPDPHAPVQAGQESDADMITKMAFLNSGKKTP
ncbi:MAG: ATP-binding cassette domain-containing protein [Magnetococcales bacterium]|nr:ATP-binding cassette domain-containing protein [Magnetococcales bacterium]